MQNLYSGTNIRTVTSIGAALQTITFTPTTAWARRFARYRFYIVKGAVTYACTPNASGTGTLKRYSGYAIQAVSAERDEQRPAFERNRSLALDDVTGCSFTAGSGLGRPERSPDGAAAHPQRRDGVAVFAGSCTEQPMSKPPHPGPIPLAQERGAVRPLGLRTSGALPSPSF